MASSRKNLVVISSGIILTFVGIFLFPKLFEQEKIVNVNIASRYLTFQQHKDVVWTAVFNPENSLVASSSIDSTVKIWRSRDGELIQNLKHPQGIPAVAFSPNGKNVAT